MKATLLGLLGLLALILVGCNNINSVERAVPNAKPDYIADKRVITNPSLAGALQIISVSQAVVTQNHLKIQLKVENLKNRAYTFHYAVEWYDAQGMQLTSPTDVSKTRTLQGRETAVLEAVAVSPAAVDFVVKFQP